MTDGGIAKCMDAKTGVEKWKQRIPGKYAASPVGTRNHVWFVAEDGGVTVVEAAAEFRQSARNRLDDSFLATPAIVGRRMFLRGENRLWCVGAP